KCAGFRFVLRYATTFRVQVRESDQCGRAAGGNCLAVPLRGRLLIPRHSVAELVHFAEVNQAKGIFLLSRLTVSGQGRAEPLFCFGLILCRTTTSSVHPREASHTGGFILLCPLSEPLHRLALVL